ncbi:histidine--tRNA ligase [Cuneatibacter sp. NSJ-177]|uniref:histidine--tRNA ligase n=1 Tax=Cuneatibacter sp. NSJ-177 TaxID=2931401 RepID=UPI001FD0D960|nr:histidine--tRNA ligase [Cuneatibacter sp. NSJ-177]MCJ7835446.1 histidine--tRNA ligase [Cuneatibacter sp. NSJ-177]
MALTKKPVNGMKDILPQEMQIRDYVIGLIKETYKSFGFTPIETPVVESLPNLTSKQGGDNEKLIFKIMKRGEKLNLETATCEEDLADSGLRYDLTVPLVRYYTNHVNDLPKPFKALQIGPVFRADRPQKGRFRQFYQCDIDILGEAGNIAEIELILATTTLLGKLGFSGFTVRINDRRMLKAMAAASGFPADSYDRVFIILDKMDKIGMEGVAKELAESGFDQAAIDKYLAMFEALSKEEDGISYLGKVLGGHLEEGAAEGLKEIVDSVEATASADFKLAFDPTLVRGMSYYTGTIFEIEIAGLGCSAGGGGRYDEMVGKFTNLQVPACGFSIGFERIITILMDQNFQVPGAAGKKAYLIEKNMPKDRLCEILKEAQAEREQGAQVLTAVMIKNKKFQKEQLAAEGYTEFREFFCDSQRN